MLMGLGRGDRGETRPVHFQCGAEQKKSPDLFIYLFIDYWASSTADVLRKKKKEIIQVHYNN